MYTVYSTEKDLPVPGGIGSGSLLLRPSLIQSCLFFLAQVTEAGRTHEFRPAKSPHGQRQSEHLLMTDNPASSQALH